MDERNFERGWLIVDGREVDAPFQVEVLDSCITINGQRVLEPTPSAGNVAVDAHAQMMHQVLTDLFASFRQHEAESGFEAALVHALEFAQRQPGIVRAELDGPDSMLIQFQGEQYPEYVDLRVPQTPPQDPAVVRATYLRSQADAIRNWLETGCGVVLDGQVLLAVPAEEGRVLHDALLDIARSWTSTESRLLEIRKHIPDEGMARHIAENFRY